MKLNDAQKTAIETITGNVAVIASAGSGKTTVLTKRIENMVKNNINPSNILAITFSKKSKEAIQEKLGNLNITKVNVETFHSLALKIIKYEYGNDYKVWTAQWEKEKVLQDICQNFGCSKNDTPYNELCVFIAMQKNAMIENENDLIYPSDLPFPKNIMKQIYVKYETWKENNKYIEFDDFLNMANRVLDTDYSALKYYQDKFKYILSDEFQDISKSQFALLKKLNSDNTMIVGDPLQAIYSFRGGDSKYILDFDKSYADVKIINLNTNYRCSEEIVKTANKLAAHIPDSKHRFYVESISNNPSNKIPEYKEYIDEYEEASGISDKINELISNGYKFSDIAILSRTNAQLNKVQTIFHEKLIPFTTVNGCLFTQLPEIRLLISYLKLSLYENDNDSFEYMYNKPNRWLDKKFLQEVKEYAIKKNLSYYHSMALIDRRNWRFKNGIDEIYETINHLQNKKFKNIGRMIHCLREKLDIDTFVTKGKQSDDGSFLEQVENMNAFENFAEKFVSLNDFIQYLNDMTKDDEITDINKVNLSTIHRAKGLEYPVVFIIGCNQGVLPHEKNDCVDDEKRLFYVAITRAEKELYLSSTQSYNSKISFKSSFLDFVKTSINEIKTEN